MLKIRRPLGRLIFNMGIAIPGKTVFLIETAPCFHELLEKCWKKWEIWVQWCTAHITVSVLTQWGQNKVADIVQTTFWYVISRTKNMIQISLKFVHDCPVNNLPALFQMMAWHHIGARPSPEPVMTTTHDGIWCQKAIMGLTEQSLQGT